MTSPALHGINAFMYTSPALLFQYDGCDTCRKAVRFLTLRHYPFTALPIRTQPPSIAQLQQMLDATGDLRRLFNTSGQDYRSLKMKERLPDLSTAEALELLSTHGNLVKRPFLLLPDGRGTTGFDEALWEKLLA